MHNPESEHGRWDTQTSLGFGHANRLLNLDQTRLRDSQQKKKKRTCQIVDFAIFADHRVKLKESEKGDKYIDLVRKQAKKQKKLLNKKVTVKPIVSGTLEQFAKDWKRDRKIWKLEDKWKSSSLKYY